MYLGEKKIIDSLLAFFPGNNNYLEHSEQGSIQWGGGGGGGGGVQLYLAN